MSDIKKFTGFIAIDGSTHSTLKSAQDHTRDFKIRKALEEKFAGLSITSEGADTGVSVADFIIANMDAIKAALNPEVLLRKKRTPKAKPTKAEAPSEPVKEAPVKTEAPAEVITKTAASVTNGDDIEAALATLG